MPDARSFLRLLSPRRSGSIALICALASLVLVGPSAAEIYKWKDGQGRLHFAQDLSQVPPQYRRQAEAGALEKGKGREIQVYEPSTPVPAARLPRARSRSKASSNSPKVHRIKVTPSGNSMRVAVKLNDDLTVPFLIDTGATDVVLPIGVARKLGLNLESARTQYYRTANGTVESQVVTLESVDLGGARVENVPASVSKSMSVGLLGLSYFNHFRYRIDPVAGIVTLEDNGMAESGAIRGGRSQKQWQNEFRRLAARRNAIDEMIDQADSKGSRYKKKLRDAYDEAGRQLDVLDDEADDARVPMRWRD
jgi:clan AA aspartic protease (TIGR02281 family)